MLLHLLVSTARYDWSILRLVFSSTARKTSEDSFETHLKDLYADREKRRETLQEEENLPDFQVNFEELFL